MLRPRRAVRAAREGVRSCRCPSRTTSPSSISRIATRRAFDFIQPDDYANCFTPDGVFDARPVGLFEGHDALRAFSAGAGETGGDTGSRHWMGNPVIEGDGDEASMTTMLMMVNTGAASTTGVTGVYRDKLVKVGGEWKIKHRHLTFEEPPEGYEE